MSDKINIFISYSHKDEEFKKQLDTHFEPLRQNGTVETIWNDRKLLAGDDKDAEIHNKLSEANVVIFLLSADFIKSEYIRSKEFLFALDRHKKKEALAIGVLVRYCLWNETEIEKFIILPEDAIPIDKSENRDETYVKVIEGIIAAAKKFLSQKETNPHTIPLPHQHNIGVKKETQTANKKKSPKMPIGTENETNPYTIPLPHQHNIGVNEEFFVKKMRDFTDKLYKFTINSQDIISELKEGYFKSEKSSKDACDNLMVFFQSICRSVNLAFFDWGGVRTHFRYLHKKDEKFLKLAAAFDVEIDHEYALTPIPSVGEGMIYHAAQFEKPLIYSLNTKWHYPTGTTLESRDFKDYITFVLINDAFRFHGECILSMGISFENPDRYKDLYFLMNLCRFDDVIVNVVKSYAEATKINVVDTIVSNNDYIKRLFTKV